jgi:hypothetical protein
MRCGGATPSRIRSMENAQDQPWGTYGIRKTRERERDGEIDITMKIVSNNFLLCRPRPYSCLVQSPRFDWQCKARHYKETLSLLLLWDKARECK